SLHSCCLPSARRSPSSPLFPYTTLFRSGDAVASILASLTPARITDPDPVALQGMAIFGADGANGICQLCPPSPENCQMPLAPSRSEEHTSELQSRGHLVCRLLLEKKNTN